MILTRCVAIALAVCLACQSAWGHTFQPMRTVVAQVEACELAVLVGFQPGTGDGAETLLARVASAPRAQQLASAKGLLTREAMAPLTFAVDGKPLVPTSVRAKLGVDPGGTRPLVFVLVTFAIQQGGTLSITSKDPKSTRISWTDQGSGRVDLLGAPTQGRWHSGVASFLLSLAAPTGVSACATSPSSTH